MIFFYSYLLLLLLGAVVGTLWGVVVRMKPPLPPVEVRIAQLTVNRYIPRQEK